MIQMRGISVHVHRRQYICLTEKKKKISDNKNTVELLSLEPEYDTEPLSIRSITS